MKRKHVYLILFFMAAIFIAIPAIGFGGDIINIIKCNKVASSGIMTEAEILNNSYESSLTVNGTPYYSIKFRFMDENGEYHTGKTSSCFTINQINLLENSGIIKIKYDPKTYLAVESNFRLTSPGNSFTILFFSIFTAVGGSLFIVLVVIIMLDKKKKIITRKGEEREADFMYAATNVTVNGIPKYYIAYSWQDDYGIINKCKSPSDYTYDEACIFEEAKRFRIKVYKKKSIIFTQPSDLLMIVDEKENS